MVLNPLIVAIAALIPLVVGFIWYNPKTFGNAWMQAADMNEDKMKGANMGLIFGLSYVFSFLIGTVITMMVIHQNHVFSVFMDMEGYDELLSKFMPDGEYGQNFRTFKHGAAHGVLTGLFFVMPIMATNALFERKGFKYIAINAGYWIVSMALMGGVICQFS